MAGSSFVVFVGLGLGWRIYGNKRVKADDLDPLERATPTVWTLLENKFYIDELYGVTVIAFYAWWAKVADWLDRCVWGGVVAGVTLLFQKSAQLSRQLDVNWVDGSFDKGCEELANSGGLLAGVQTGRVQLYLRLLALAVVLLTAILIWSSQG
jgi:NADH-quinone oxidoreductase subunit L